MSWRPAHEAHAIERVNFSVLFQDGLPAKLWGPLLSAFSAKAQGEGFVMSQTPSGQQNGFQEVFINLAGGVSPQIVNVEDFRIFQIVRSGDLIEEMRVSRSSFTYTTTRYSRWHNFDARCMALYSDLFDSMCRSTDVATLKLEYFDRFIYNGAPSDADFGGCLNPNSHSVPDFCFDAKDLWHVHVGRFEVVGQTRRLFNANVDAIDVMLPDPSLSGPPSVQRSIGIYTMAEDRFVADANRPDSALAIGNAANDLHMALKASLDDIIHPELAESISLHAGSSK